MWLLHATNDKVRKKLRKQGEKMDLSIYLAKVMGLYLLIVSFGLLINKKRLIHILIDFLKNPPLVFLSGFFALVIGLLLVTSHNIWIMDWPVLITILGWLSLIKGTIRIAFPHFLVTTSQKWIQNDTFYNTTFFIMIFIGFTLLYYGYMVVH